MHDQFKESVDIKFRSVQHMHDTLDISLSDSIVYTGVQNGWKHNIYIIYSLLSAMVAKAGNSTQH